jgi:hypothetical protein
MHATMRSNGPQEPMRAIRGVFYPSDDRSGPHSAFPKIIGLLVAMALVRTVLARHHGDGGSSRWSRRREMIAELHRELHAQEDAPAPESGAATKA